MPQTILETGFGPMRIKIGHLLTQISKKNNASLELSQGANSSGFTHNTS